MKIPTQKKMLQILNFIFSSVLIGICFTQTAQAVTMSLGQVDFTAVSSMASSSPDIAKTIDGDTSTAGWTLAKDAGVSSGLLAHSIDVTLAQPTLPTLQPGERVDHYTYSISYHYEGINSPKDFMLSTTFNGQFEPNTQINFDSLSTNYGANTISVGPAPAGHPWAPQGSPGMITTTDPGSTPPSIVIHTLVFKGNTPLEFLRLTTILNPGWTDGSLVLNEVTGIVSAEIVPEPSTYALLAGIVAFAFIAKRKRTKA